MGYNWEKAEAAPMFDTVSGNLEDGQYAVINPFKYAVKRAGEEVKCIHISETFLNENEYTDFDKNNYMVWRKGMDASLELKEKFDSKGLKEVESKPYDVSGLTLVNVVGEKYISQFKNTDTYEKEVDVITDSEYIYIKSGVIPPVKK